ncbi:GTP-dependent dephospho-CoA kinase family protein [Candidatus Hodarchaeum mangrovi]
MGYKLPHSLRESLRTPIGKIFSGSPLETTQKVIDYIEGYNNPIVTSIGDFCTKYLLDKNFYPNIIIYDGKTRRNDSLNLNLGKYQLIDVVNPPEWITNDSWNIIKNTISFCTSNKCRVAIRIQGEEDLLVIPTLLLSPIGSLIVYGQPPFDKKETGGIVVIFVNLKAKNDVKSMFKRFKYYEEVKNGNNNN